MTTPLLLSELPVSTLSASVTVFPVIFSPAPLPELPVRVLSLKPVFPLI